MGSLDSGSSQNSFETDPAHYAIVMHKRKDVWTNPRTNDMGWAIAINMKTGKMYVGDSHDEMEFHYHIPQNAYWKAIAQIDLEQKKVEMTHLFDATKPVIRKIESGPVKEALDTAIRQGLLALAEEQS